MGEKMTDAEMDRHIDALWQKLAIAIDREASVAKKRKARDFHNYKCAVCGKQLTDKKARDVADLALKRLGQRLCANHYHEQYGGAVPNRGMYAARRVTPNWKHP